MSDEDYDEVTARRQADAEAARDEQRERALILEEREACADLVEVAGCICGMLGDIAVPSAPPLPGHDEHCPYALAAKIRDRA